jgi:flagellin-specific chaperone FliS
MRQDPAALDKVNELLGELRESWAELAAQPQPQAVATPA